MSEKIIIRNVRCAHVKLLKPGKDDKFGNPGKFGMQILLPKKHPQLEEITKITHAIAKQAHPKSKIGALKMPIRDGEETFDDDHYKDTMFFNANNSSKPGLVNRYGKPPSESDIEEMGFSGCYFHASVTFDDYNVEGVKGICAYLNNVMLRKAGEPLGSGESAANAFADLADDELADDELDVDFD